MGSKLQLQEKNMMIENTATSAEKRSLCQSKAANQQMVGK